MKTRAAAHRWAATWTLAWPAGDAAAIAALYVDEPSYRSHPFRDPEPAGARGYTERVFAQETAVECRFGEAIVDGRRAAVEWWATLVEDGEPVTLAGTSLLRFDESGRVVEHVDYWVSEPGRRTRPGR